MALIVGMAGSSGITLSIWHIWTSSSMSSTRIMPNFLHSASKALSEPDRLPVCEDATLLPASLLPTLSMTMGFLISAARLRTSANFSGSLTPSR